MATPVHCRRAQRSACLVTIKGRVAGEPATCSLQQETGFLGQGVVGAVGCGTVSCRYLQISLHNVTLIPRPRRQYILMLIARYDFNSAW